MEKKSKVRKKGKVGKGGNAGKGKKWEKREKGGKRGKEGKRGRGPLTNVYRNPPSPPNQGSVRLRQALGAPPAPPGLKYSAAELSVSTAVAPAGRGDSLWPSAVGSSDPPGSRKRLRGPAK